MRKRPDTCIESFHIAFHYQVPTILLGILVTELYHLLKLPLGIDVHQRERHFAGSKRLFGQAHHNRRILADTIQHHRIFKLRCHFTDNMNGLCFEFLQMAQFIFFFHYILFLLNSW